MNAKNEKYSKMRLKNPLNPNHKDSTPSPNLLNITISCSSAFPNHKSLLLKEPEKINYNQHHSPSFLTTYHNMKFPPSPLKPECSPSNSQVHTGQKKYSPSHKKNKSQLLSLINSQDKQGTIGSNLENLLKRKYNFSLNQVNGSLFKMRHSSNPADNKMGEIMDSIPSERLPPKNNIVNGQGIGLGTLLNSSYKSNQTNPKEVLRIKCDKCHKILIKERGHICQANSNKASQAKNMKIKKEAPSIVLVNLKKKKKEKSRNTEIKTSSKEGKLIELSQSFVLPKIELGNNIKAVNTIKKRNNFHERSFSTINNQSPTNLYATIYASKGLQIKNQSQSPPKKNTETSESEKSFRAISRQAMNPQPPEIHKQNLQLEINNPKVNLIFVDKSKGNYESTKQYISITSKGIDYQNTNQIVSERSVYNKEIIDGSNTKKQSPNQKHKKERQKSPLHLISSRSSKPLRASLSKLKVERSTEATQESIFMNEIVKEKSPMKYSERSTETDPFDNYKKRISSVFEDNALIRKQSRTYNSRNSKESTTGNGLFGRYSRIPIFDSISEALIAKQVPIKEVSEDKTRNQSHLKSFLDSGEESNVSHETLKSKNILSPRMKQSIEENIQTPEPQSSNFEERGEMKGMKKQIHIRLNTMQMMHVQQLDNGEYIIKERMMKDDATSPFDEVELSQLNSFDNELQTLNASDLISKKGKKKNFLEIDKIDELFPELTPPISEVRSRLVRRTKVFSRKRGSRPTNTTPQKDNSTNSNQISNIPITNSNQLLKRAQTLASKRQIEKKKFIN